MAVSVLNAGVLWLQPGGEHPVCQRYADLFGRLFRKFEALDYRASYLNCGAKALEDRILSALASTKFDVLVYTQFPGSYSYVSPEFLAGLRRRLIVVGMGWDDEMYFDQARYFYQACNSVITTDIQTAEWLKDAGIPAHVVLTAWLRQPGDAARTDEDIAVSFVGDMAKPGRREYIRYLEASGISVSDFGAGSRNGALPDATVAEVFRRSKINLNFTTVNPPRWILRHDPRRAQARQIKGRPFELAELGRFCLCEWMPGMERWFRPGVDIGVFRDPEDLVVQVRRYLDDSVLRVSMSSSAQERFRTELAPEIQFYRVFSRILSDAHQQVDHLPAPALDGAIFYESMGRSRGVAFLHALHRGSPLRALSEMFMKWSGHLVYWRGFAEAVLETVAGRLRRA